MSARLWAIAIALLMPPAVAAGSDEAPTLDEAQRMAILDEAQQSYEQGVALLRNEPLRAREHFRTAADRFELLVADGVDNGRLFYNLGNAYLQADELGLAIVNYRRAQSLIPGDARLKSNLSYARSLARSRIAPSGDRALLDALLIWHRQTSTRARFIAFIACYSLFWAVVLLRQFHRRPGWKYPGAALLAVGALLGVSVGLDMFGPGAADDGVIVADDVVVRKGNGAGFAPQFEEPLHQGVEFTRLEDRAGWLRIRLPDASEGWIREDQSAMIRPAPATGPQRPA